MSLSTSDLYDQRGDELQSLSLHLQSFGGVTRFSGVIRTVRCLRDNVLMKGVLSERGDGSVLVVDGHGSLQSALMGDQIAELAASNGWAGVVLNAAIRDRTALARVPIGIRALGSNPRKSTKNGGGEVDVVLEIADAVFRPGAMIYCDEDGILLER